MYVLLKLGETLVSGDVYLTETGHGVRLLQVNDRSVLPTERKRYEEMILAKYAQLTWDLCLNSAQYRSLQGR